MTLSASSLGLIEQKRWSKAVQDARSPEAAISLNRNQRAGIGAPTITNNASSYGS
jgi:hypothetical protein